MCDIDKVKNTCIEMFNIRNYSNIEIEYENNIPIINAIRNEKIKIRCYILHNMKLNKNLLKYYYSLCISNDIKHLILIYTDNLTSSVTKLLEYINSVCIECFRMDELLFNITKHELVPLHVKVDSKLHPQKNQYPIIKKTDIISRFYGFKSGDVIEIHRKNKTIFYRVVR